MLGYGAQVAYRPFASLKPRFQTLRSEMSAKTRSNLHPASKALQQKRHFWQDDVSGIYSSQMSTQEDAHRTFLTGNTTQATHEVAEEPLICVDEELRAGSRGQDQIGT